MRSLSPARPTLTPSRTSASGALCLDRLQANDRAQLSIAQPQDQAPVDDAVLNALTPSKRACGTPQVAHDPPLAGQVPDRKMLSRDAEVADHEVAVSPATHHRLGARANAQLPGVGPYLKIRDASVGHVSPPYSAGGVGRTAVP